MPLPPAAAGWPLTVSIGIAVAPEHGSDPETLLKAADAALYEAKAGGRDLVVAAPVDATTGCGQ